MYFFILIDLRRPLVIHGLENCLALRFDKILKGACSLMSLLSLL